MAFERATIRLTWHTEMNEHKQDELTEELAELSQDLAAHAQSMADDGLLRNSKILLSLEAGHGAAGNDTPKELDQIVKAFGDKIQHVRSMDAEPVEQLSGPTMEMISELTARNKTRAESELLQDDEYQRGVYNGMEHIAAALEGRPPQLRMAGGEYQAGIQWDDEF